MKENWLKNTLYQRLSHPTKSDDFDMLWDQIEARRYPKKKRKSFLIWIFACLVFAGILYYSSGSDVESTPSAKYHDIAYTDLENDAFLIKSEMDSLNSYDELAPEYSNALEIQNAILNEADYLNVDRSAGQNYRTSKNIINRGRVSQSDIGIHNDEHVITEIKAHDPIGRKAISISSIGRPLNKLILPVRELKVTNILQPSSYTLPTIKTSGDKNILSTSFSYGLMYSELTGGKSDVSQAFSEYYFDERNRIENNVDYLDLSINYKRRLRRGFTASVGVSLQMYTSRYVLTTTDKNTVTTLDTVEIYYSGDEIADVILGDVEVTTTKRIQSTNYIKQLAINIPVSLAYEFDISNQYTIAIAGGATFGLPIHVSSLVIDPDFPSSDFSTLHVAGYHKGIIIGGLSQVTINRYFSNGWVVHGGLKYNRDISNRLYSSTAANHNLSSVNISLGLGRRF